MKMNGENNSDNMGEARTAGQPLSDFLQQLEDYTPTVNPLSPMSYLLYSKIWIMTYVN